ncbi:MAG: acyl carrier protein [Acidimicrobiales bacterium]|nr:acyl carrier protein [Acidimicrobiales bacterium]
MKGDTLSAGPLTNDATILKEVVAMITDVVGEDYAIDLDIDMETSFQEDLELESIEFVTLAEKLMETYGEKVDFTGWIASMDVDEIIAMTVGQLVDFITKCQSESGEE